MPFKLTLVPDTDPNMAYLALGISSERIHQMETMIETEYNEKDGRITDSLVRIAEQADTTEELAYSIYMMGLAIGAGRKAQRASDLEALLGGMGFTSKS